MHWLTLHASCIINTEFLRPAKSKLWVCNGTAITPSTPSSMNDQTTIPHYWEDLEASWWCTGGWGATDGLERWKGLTKQWSGRLSVPVWYRGCRNLTRNMGFSLIREREGGQFLQIMHHNCNEREAIKGFTDSYGQICLALCDSRLLQFPALYYQKGATKLQLELHLQLVCCPDTGSPLWLETEPEENKGLFTISYLHLWLQNVQHWFRSRRI